MRYRVIKHLVQSGNTVGAQNHGCFSVFYLFASNPTPHLKMALFLHLPSLDLRTQRSSFNAAGSPPLNDSQKQQLRGTSMKKAVWAKLCYLHDMSPIPQYTLGNSERMGHSKCDHQLLDLYY